ncbi:hypothetical protein NC796_03270 [Aliifodinibius sp. S!AR15-10]|uniref:hypothetical protein n=1 Tax=Aliifodinibius sp. S!AR15-10 TaxID=2950437 RepID=UPI00285E1A3E|nr:hypothetical protein [Aliifodinibius sp. S!AR15-10]MDR8390146.1 hypothetical protein [Aliifodinibius sp. S!AR15-10]
MTEDSRKTYQRLKNDLERMVPDSELNPREEDLLMTEPEQTKSSQFWEDTKRFAKNFLVATLCVIIGVLWLFDWNVSAMMNRTSDVISGLLGNAPAQVQGPPPLPETPPLPSLPEIPAEIEEEIRAEIDANQDELEMGMSEYVSAITEAGYRDQFTIQALSAMYHSGVEVSYLDQLNEAGLLEELAFPAIITFYSADVSVDYLAAMKEGGYFEQFGFPGVAALASADVPVSYLDELREKGLLEDLAFHEVIMMYNSE